MQGGGERGEGKYDYNTEYITEMVRSGTVKPCLQFKVTAMLPLDTVISLTSIPARGEVTMVSLAEQVAEVIHTGGELSMSGLTERE